MRGILADINVGRQRDALVSIFLSDAWRDIWNGLGLIVESFPALGLSNDASDALIWRICQREALVLLTANRNKHGPDSLQGVIEDENQPESLPVITIADAGRVLRDRPYMPSVSPNNCSTI